MSEQYPSAEALRLSNALGNLGSAAVAIEGASVEVEKALLDMTLALRMVSDQTEADVLSMCSPRTLRTLIAVASRYGWRNEFIEFLRDAEEDSRNA